MRFFVADDVRVASELQQIGRGYAVGLKQLRPVEPGDLPEGEAVFALGPAQYLY